MRGRTGVSVIKGQVRGRLRGGCSGAVAQTLKATGGGEGEVFLLRHC